MATGTTLRADVADLVMRFDNSVSAQQDIVMRLASVAQREIVSELISIDDDFLTATATFALVANRSPNRYDYPDDFQNFRYLERVIDESTGSYERIWPIHHISDKEFTYDDEFAGVLVTSSSATGRPLAYLLGDDFIQIEPISDAAYTCRIWYQKSLADITTEGTIAIPYALYNALVYKTCSKFLKRLNADSSDFEMMYEKALARGMGAVGQRHDDLPRTVNYVRNHPREYV